MGEKEGSLLRRHDALHSEEGMAALTRRPGAKRRSVCLVIAAALATATLVLFLAASRGYSCRHVRLSSGHDGAGGGAAQIWAGSSGAPPPDGPAAIGSNYRRVDAEPDAPPAGLDAGTGTPVVLRRQSANVTTTSATATATVLENFEVHQPVLTPSGATLDDGESTGGSSSVGESCSVVLMDHIFAYSYGAPYVGNYTPPSCEFNRVVINFTVVSEGKQ
jgi:hypothetical protein